MSVPRGPRSDSRGRDVDYQNQLLDRTGSRRNADIRRGCADSRRAATENSRGYAVPASSDTTSAAPRTAPVPAAANDIFRIADCPGTIEETNIRPMARRAQRRNRLVARISGT